MAPWQFGRMEAAEPRNPYHSYAGTLFAQYPADSPLGRTMRQADARKRLTEMDEAEAETGREQALRAKIAGRIERMEALHRLNMDYLIRFGVRADKREAFREVLKEVAEQGSLTLRQAADFVHNR